MMGQALQIGIHAGLHVAHAQAGVAHGLEDESHHLVVGQEQLGSLLQIADALVVVPHLRGHNAEFGQAGGIGMARGTGSMAKHAIGIGAVVTHIVAHAEGEEHDDAAVAPLCQPLIGADGLGILPTEILGIAHLPFYVDIGRVELMVLHREFQGLLRMASLVVFRRHVGHDLCIERESLDDSAAPDEERVHLLLAGKAMVFEPHVGMAQTVIADAAQCEQRLSVIAALIVAVGQPAHGFAGGMELQRPLIPLHGMKQVEVGHAAVAAFQTAEGLVGPIPVVGMHGYGQQQEQQECKDFHCVKMVDWFLFPLFAGRNRGRRLSGRTVSP